MFRAFHNLFRHRPFIFTLLIVFACVNIAIAQAQSTLAPSVTLEQFHSGCQYSANTRNPDCTAAAHRYCITQGHEGGFAYAAGNNKAVVTCFDPTLYQDVPLSTLRGFHSGCNDFGKSQTADCVAAAHRWCLSNGQGDYGISQEVGNGAMGITCFNGASYQDVPLNSLKQINGGCNDAGQSQSSACVSAMQTWCSRLSANSGLAQEVSSGNLIGVTCFRAQLYQNIDIGQSPPPPPSPSPLPSTPSTGILTVGLGFGAAGAYQCTGSGTVTITYTTGESRQQSYSYSGMISSNTSPACRINVTFDRLQAGVWIIQDSISGAACRKQVNAGQYATATIYYGIASC